MVIIEILRKLMMVTSRHLFNFRGIIQKQFDGYVEPKYNIHCIFGMQSCVCIGHLTGKCCQCLYLCKSRQQLLVERQMDIFRQ